MINTKSIQFRLILWYSGLITLVSIIFGAAVYHDVEIRLYRNTESTLSRRAQQMSADILPRFSSADKADLAHAIDEVYSPDTTDQFIRITADDKSLVYVSERPGDGLFDPARVAASPEQITKRLEPLGNDLKMLIVSQPARLRDQAVTVEMGSVTNETTAVLDNLRRSLLIGLPLVALIVSAGGYVLVRRSLRVVEQLRAKAQEISFGNLETRLPVVHSGDSIEQLAVTLNQMLARLSEAYNQASRFSGDASHELRTPLAIMRAELESLAREPTSPPLRDRIASLLEETERLSFITEGLFALSRLEAGEAKVRDIRLDLAALVNNTMDQVKLLTEDKGISLVVDAKTPVMVQGDPARLKQVIVDLLDNAIKYTPSGGRITLRTFAVGQQAVLEVSDTGIGISAEDIPHVFERFYRADKARSRQIDGAGLGLAIVRTICQAHGGSVHIDSVEGTGTTCHVQIPLAA